MKEVMTINREENRKHWVTIIETQNSSNLTQVKWCEANNISIHNFRYWASKLNRLKTEAETNQGFVSLRPLKINTPDSISVKIGAAVVEVNDSIDLNLLDDVIKVLVRYA